MLDRMHAPWPASQSGDTLLEVLTALFVLAFAALGTVALQGWVGRSEQAARWLDAAVDAATTAAETMRAGLGAGPDTVAANALAQQTALALPDGHIVVTPLAGGLARIDVDWTEPPRWGGAASGAAGAADSACTASGASGHPGWQPRCLSVWVAQ